MLTNRRKLIFIGPNITTDYAAQVEAELGKVLSVGVPFKIVCCDHLLLKYLEDKYKDNKNFDLEFNFYTACVDTQELLKAHNYCYDFARNWFKRPPFVEFTDQFTVMGVNMGVVLELEVILEIVGLIRDLVVFRQITKSYQSVFGLLLTARDVELFQDVCGVQQISCVVGEMLLLPLPKQSFITSWPDKVKKLSLYLLCRLIDYGRTVWEALVRRKQADSISLLVEEHRISLSLLENLKNNFHYNVLVTVSPLDYKTRLKYWDTNLKPCSLRRYTKVNDSVAQQVYQSLWRQVKSQIVSADQFCFVGINWGKYVLVMFANIMLNRFVSLKKQIQQIDSLLNVSSPQVIVLASYVDTQQRILIDLARKKDIPSLALQHGIMNSSKISSDMIHVDFYATWGHKEKDEFERLNKENHNKCQPVGSMVYDDLNRVLSRSGEKEEILKCLGISPTQKIILYAPPDHHIFTPLAVYPWHMYLLSDLLDVVGDMPDVVLIVKLHPMTDQNLHNKYKLMIKGKNVNAILLSNCDMWELIKAADCLLVLGSTTAVDGIVVGKPVVSLDYFKAVFSMPFVQDGAALKVQNKQELAAALWKILSADGEVLERLAKGRQVFLHNYVNDLRSGSIDRMKALIEKLAKENVCVA
ncbi:hypothetical protein A2291_03095 [candidate division WOR-1 bacterium RIFOXYB2_FULL_42_35]|uniref:UDP-N-acetylglucosamine 2-epimerase domain-containing protein n=1 Tax=candidate division WOR-1 bacterium RIFOXYC2_FULL_41_25 TaxID=1802586 RepID=A0A1F4TQX9_UNCSA|nr:MAG: hypothetical protein A2247_01405 [candidate division WOR-1 bacterium RIFOXYA2_FULL_41_14]OGC25732.1 MAG: hypothetical protein A2291_03095 [candidate division WOR-1 bacterium RIFOXYB2_FULL_42_35]OGC35134.1 MAG: hypothetical protein A2462_06240 [candidate division WOR-1 bacterium RIFOXYC2_FULL_41_25]OGC42191.1 MAG: hypothetical protein A2548_03525 [candidate division WOR-1 bacterium RIFOXYD2_FULL_41_8]